jgi:hypothetical protein
MTLVLFSQCYLLAHAASISADDSEVIVHDAQKVQQIDELFALRSALSLNFDQNATAIYQIDQQLSQLGVEIISYGDILCKMGCDVDPLATPVSADPNTQWTSRRSVVTYRGQQYELEIIDGVPLNSNSFLRENYLYVEYNDYRIVAGTTGVIETIGVTALGELPDVGKLITLFDIAADIGGTIYDAITPTTVIDAVAGSASIFMSTHMRYVFVKGYGSSDSYQKLGYMGNLLTYNIVTVIAQDSEMGEHGSVAIPNVTVNQTMTAQSVYFDDYSVALRNYYNFRNNINEPYVCEYTLQTITLKILGREQIFRIPNHAPSFTF